MTTVCQFFYYAPSHELQSILPLPYALVTHTVTPVFLIIFCTLLKRVEHPTTQSQAQKIPIAK